MYSGRTGMEEEQEEEVTGPAPPAYIRTGEWRRSPVTVARTKRGRTAPGHTVTIVVTVSRETGINCVNVGGVELGLKSRSGGSYPFCMFLGNSPNRFMSPLH
jgi:hypothetical protein